MSRLRDRRSALAHWSARLGSLAIPVVVITAVSHRARLIDATSAYSALALGCILAAVAVVAAFGAFVAVWRDGRGGAGAAVRGLGLGLAVLAIPTVAAWRIVVYPPLTDIATDPRNPPAFAAARTDRAAGDAVIADPTEAEVALQEAAYPDIVPRHYPVDPGRVYDEVRTIVDRHAWSVLAARPPTEISPSARIEAVATTLLFGFRQDVVVEVIPDGDGALVRMRSAARNGSHDLGANAERIRGFFADLDTALKGVVGE